MANKPIEHNYHCHTSRCGHASGSDEEYVLAALSGGYKTLGFSDHIFLPYHEQPGMRGSFALLPDYLSSIRALKERYQQQIAIHLGFEAEYFPDDYREYYAKLLNEGIVEYLLLGQHLFLKDHKEFVWYGTMSDKKEAARKYTDDLISGMRSGLFLYVAHPDLFASWTSAWDEVSEECAREIIGVAKDLKIPLEINMGPSRRERRDYRQGNLPCFYPSDRFWDLVAEAGVPAVYGVDAHAPKELSETPFDWFRNFAKSKGIEPLSRLDLTRKKE